MNRNQRREMGSSWRGSSGNNAEQRTAPTGGPHALHLCSQFLGSCSPPHQWLANLRPSSLSTALHFPSVLLKRSHHVEVVLSPCSSRSAFSLAFFRFHCCSLLGNHFFFGSRSPLRFFFPCCSLTASSLVVGCSSKSASFRHQVSFLLPGTHRSHCSSRPWEAAAVTLMPRSFDPSTAPPAPSPAPAGGRWPPLCRRPPQLRYSAAIASSPANCTSTSPCPRSVSENKIISFFLQKKQDRYLYSILIAFVSCRRGWCTHRPMMSASWARPCPALGCPAAARHGVWCRAGQRNHRRHHFFLS
jgi:hypothetical protein